jgi:hypothetical protein
MRRTGAERRDARPIVLRKGLPIMRQLFVVHRADRSLAPPVRALYRQRGAKLSADVAHQREGLFAAVMMPGVKARCAVSSNWLTPVAF